MEIWGLAWARGNSGEEEVTARPDVRLGLWQIGGINVDVEDHITCREQ